MDILAGEGDFVLTLIKTNIVFAIILIAYFTLRRDPRIKYHLDKIGGPPTLPVLGNATQLWRPHNELFPLVNDWFKEFGTTTRFWVGNIVPYVLTCDVKVLEKVLSGMTYIDKGKHDYSLLHDWLGSGLLTSPGSKWAIRRKMLTPSFHFKILEDFVPVFNEQASVLLECLDRDGRDDGKTFNMYPYITKCTLDIICETAMGKKINAQTSTANKDYFDAVNGMCALLLDKNLMPWLRIPFIYRMTSMCKREKQYLRIVKGLTEEVIRARKEERITFKAMHNNIEGHIISETSFKNFNIYGKRRKAFLDLLLDVADESQQLSDADICEEVDTFMFEGHDTTAVNLAWTVLLLSMHPEYQKLVQEELDEIFVDDQTRDVTSADISKMKYLECCVKESLRMFPSVPFIMRQVDNDLQLDEGRIIPKGATVMICIYWLHRQEENFTNADKFIPERWSSSSDNTSSLSKKRNPYAYVPFSAGPRNCIGQKFALMEEKIILAKLFRTYRFETDEKMENLRPLPDVVLRCENGVHVRLHKR